MQYPETFLELIIIKNIILEMIISKIWSAIILLVY